MGLVRRLLDRLMAEDVPPKCPCCRQDDLPLERVGPIRFWCGVCARDFDAIRDGDAWRFDVTPLRVRQRLSAS